MTSCSYIRYPLRRESTNYKYARTMQKEDRLSVALMQKEHKTNPIKKDEKTTSSSQKLFNLEPYPSQRLFLDMVG